MRHLLHFFHLVIGLMLLTTPVSAKPMDFDPDYVPLPIQEDIQQYINHATGKESNNHALIIEDLERIIQHVGTPTPDDIKKDIERWQIFGSPVFDHIRREIAMSARLALFAHYYVLGNQEKALDALPSSIYMEDCYNGKIGATMLTDYMGALAAFEEFFPNISDVIIGKNMVYEERAIVIYKSIMVYSCMMRAMHIQPYDCKQRNKSIELSVYDPVNVMLLDAQLTRPIVGLIDISEVKGDDVESMLQSIISVSLKGISDVIFTTCDRFRYPDSKQLLYVFRFAFDTVMEASNEKISTLSKFSVLQFLSQLRYAPATLELGLRTESGEFNDMRPYNAKTKDLIDYNAAYRFYEKAVEQGSETAKILQARCLVHGRGCKANKKQAFNLLQPLVEHDDFPKYGAFTYANLLSDKSIGAKYEPVMLIELWCQAAQCSYNEEEQQTAREIIESMYEEYFK